MFYLYLTFFSFGVMDSYFKKVQKLQKPKHKVLTPILKPETNQARWNVT